MYHQPRTSTPLFWDIPPRSSWDANISDDKLPELSPICLEDLSATSPEASNLFDVLNEMIDAEGLMHLMEKEDDSVEFLGISAREAPESSYFCEGFKRLYYLSGAAAEDAAQKKSAGEEKQWEKSWKNETIELDGYSEEEAPPEGFSLEDDHQWAERSYPYLLPL